MKILAAQNSRDRMLDPTEIETQDVETKQSEEVSSLFPPSQSRFLSFPLLLDADPLLARLFRSQSIHGLEESEHAASTQIDTGE